MTINGLSVKLDAFEKEAVWARENLENAWKGWRQAWEKHADADMEKARKNTFEWHEYLAHLERECIAMAQELGRRREYDSSRLPIQSTA